VPHFVLPVMATHCASFVTTFRKLSRMGAGHIPLFGYAPEIPQTSEGPGLRPALREFVLVALP